MSGAWTRGVVNAFRRLGLDVDALCQQVGTPVEVFTDPTGRPKRDDAGRLWRAALIESGDRHLALSAGGAWDARADHLVVLLLTSADAVGEGLEACLRYQELLSHARVLSLTERDDCHLLQINKVEDRLPITAHEIEYLAVIAVKVLRFATDDQFAARAVEFQHPYRGDIQKYTRAFGCSVTFGHERTSIVIDDEAWNLPLVHGNQALHGQLEGVAANLHALLESRPFVDTVRDRIKAMLPKGQHSIESVASALHMTPRTLQRRLQQEGTTFREITDSTRRAILVDCVERNQTELETMRHAGYTNARSFRRAMKRWNLSDLQ